MNEKLYHCERHADGTCPHKTDGCKYRIPHEHGAHTGPVSLWCAVPNGKTEMIRCVAVRKGENMSEGLSNNEHEPRRGAP